MAKDKNLKVKGPDRKAPKVEARAPVEAPIHVSLKYWHTGSQCISAWQAKELEGFRKAVDKMQSLTPTKLKTEGGLQWKLHKGKVATGFSRPGALSKDIPLCEVRTSGKARLHGAIFDGTFFLVWLDRNHEVFPEK